MVRVPGMTADHEFVLDPGSLAGVPFCTVYDGNGHQCEAAPEDHPQPSGSPWDDIPPDALEVINEHGVKGEEISRTFIPHCCLECDHFEEGETGDYGKVYSYPGCMLGLILPTRKGTCKRQETKKRRPVESPT